MSIAFTKLQPDAKPPFLATANSIGADIHAYLKTEYGKPSTMLVAPGATRLVPTGLIVVARSNPLRDEAARFLAVCSRSGLATKGIFVANAPGIIDPDYRGELKVILFNGSPEPHWVQHNDRIAQLVTIAGHVPNPFESQFPLSGEVTERGDKGFGSSGK
jgi:dUTP pyrophosphatase